MNHRNRNGIGFWLELLEFGVSGITRVFPVRVQPGFNPYEVLSKNFPQGACKMPRVKAKSSEKLTFC